MTRPRKLIVFYGSERMDAKSQRRRARAALRRGLEPEPHYHTSKFWVD